MPRVPIFRVFRHDALKQIGIASGFADASFLASVAANTNKLVRERRHTPPVQEGHDSRDQKARGWVSDLQTDGQVLTANLSLTPRGKQLVDDKEVRYVSASFRSGFKLTGDSDSETMPGPWLAHLALLGTDAPAVKQLTDLSEITFSDDSDADTPRAWVQFSDNEVTVFSEMAPAEPEGDVMPEGNNNEARFAAIEAQLATQKTTITQLEKDKADLSASFAESETKRTAAEAKLKETTDAAAAAKFSEYQTKVTDRVKKAQKDLKLGAEKALSLIERAKTVYGDPDKEALFAELLDNLAPVVPTKKLGEGDSGGEDGKGEYGASSADFAEMRKVQKDPAAVSRVHAATIAYMADKEEESYVKAQAAVERLASKHAAN